MTQKVPFYHNKKDSTPVVALKDWEQRAKDEDWEDIKNQRQHRDREKSQWNRAAFVYNVLQTGTTDDRIANVALGYTRMILDTGIAQMSEGEPDFDFQPIGPSDWRKTVLWKALLKSNLSRCNYQSQQNIFLTDWHVFGNSVFEVFNEYPQRTIRKDMGDGKYEEIVIRDWRRPKVGVRAVSPFRCTRNPNVSDVNDVPSCTKEELLTWNQFVQNYGRATLPSGKLKYKNINMIAKGSHVQITKYYDEIRDVFRIYAHSFGNESDGFIAAYDGSDLGIPIFDKPLKIHDEKMGGVRKRSEGLNIQGKCPLVFAQYNDKLDNNGQTHSVYGMGVPQHMEGIDTLVQTFFNMNIDNWRLANTVLLSYQGDGRNVPDFDANEYYGGELFEGSITPVPMGQSRNADFQGIMDIINSFSVPMTGINFNQIIGDTSKTAFEFSQRIRANNRRAEQKLRVLESGAFKRMGELLLSASLTELTVPEYEDMTEEQVTEAVRNIEAGNELKEDFSFKDGKPAQRKRRTMIPVEGIRESLGKNKSRKLDYENTTSNTLVRDDSGKENMIPVTEEYFYSSDYIERGILPDVIVDSKRMLGDLKSQDTQTFRSVINAAFELAQADPEFAKKLDASAMFEEMLRFANINSNAILKEGGNTTIEKLKQGAKTIEDMIIGLNNPTNNVQIPEATAKVNLEELTPGSQGLPQPPIALEGAATGAL